ncbi:hypothetical protein KC19_12G165400 [Ceratodon purpureus]|uniref:DUF7806 domain-containing protein n=1 Tax=Ceratodon purpureus TaxID=3225 RepID=A0A8T0GA96_CERPU|nr:hypothetical protein KC19_12G165400 [Ceratodon purpureus]
MEKKKRRGYRDSEGDGETVSLGAVPLPPLSPPRKRVASMACLGTATQLQDEAGALRITLGDARASSDGRKESAHTATVLLSSDGQKGSGATGTVMLGLENPIAVPPSPELSLGLQRDGDEGDNMAIAWSLERNLPKEAFLPTLLRAYDNVHARYTRMKARKLDIEAQFEEQRSSHERFQQVADRYIQDMCSENQELRKTLDAAEKRIKWLESLYLKCQKDGFRACGRSAEEVLQKPDCEADIAASPVRPLTPTTDKVAAEGAPIQVEVQLPSEHSRQRGTEGVAECRVGDTAPQEVVGDRGNEETQEIEMARDGERLDEIAATEEHVSNEGHVGPSRSDGEHHLISTQNSVGEILATNQVLKSPPAVPALESSLENARCREDSAPAELDKAIVVCPEPIDCRLYSNEAEFQDLHRKYVELQDLHRKEVELLDQQRVEAELQFHHREEAELQNLHRKEFELQRLHREEVAGLLLEVEMLQKVLGHFIGMTVLSDEIARARRGKPTLIFSHSSTGFRFSLELPVEHDVSQAEVAKDLELSYRNLSLGTLCRVAPWWMKEEFFCSVTQLGNFMRRFQETVTGRKLQS